MKFKVTKVKVDDVTRNAISIARNPNLSNR